MIAQILQIAAFAQQLLGTEAGKAILAALGAHMQLNDEQKRNLDANFTDYLARVERLRAEIAQQPPNG